jgi:predicted amidohydrolase YtcJ
MFFILLCLGLLATSAAQAQPADLTVTNARIYTMDDAHPLATQMAVRGGRIVAVDSGVQDAVGPNSRRIDAAGATVVPGFIDSHGHMAALGEMLETFDLRDVRTVEEIAAIVRKAASSRAKGEWIQGRAWDQTNWGGVFPTEQALTAAAPDNPVYLSRVDGHAGWANRRAMEIAGVTKDTPDPQGGRIIRAANGQPTGIFIDRAQGLIAGKIPAATPEQIGRRLERAAKECARLGLTTVHDAGIPAGVLDAYRELLRERKLPIRVYAMIGGDGDLWRQYLKRGPEIGDRLTVRTIKLVADGAMGSRGAAFWQPYSDDPGNSGLLILSRETIERIGRDAYEHGFQVATHAIGDRANRTALDAYAAILKGRNDRRWRIEHAQIVSLPDFRLFAENSVIASVQATHATSDMRWVEKRIGPDRMAGAYAWQRFLKAGIHMPNGSDFPVESPNPLFGMYAAITRQDRNGNPPGGWVPDQRLTPEQALRSWTVEGAYAAFEEGQKGRIAPGMLADFVLLSDDIMREDPSRILKAHVKMTVVGGEVVYSE